MIWLVVSIAAVCAAFMCVLAGTANIWAAADAAGGLALIVLVVAAIRLTRPPVPGRVRACFLGATLLGLAGVSAHWLIVQSTTNFQYDTLQLIRRHIERGMISSKMEERSLPVFAAYYRRIDSHGKPLAKLFDAMNPMIDPTVNLLDTLGEGIKVYATATSDSEIVLSGVSGFAAGRDRTFKNLDGRTGLLQSRMMLTPAGVQYEIQN